MKIAKKFKSNPLRWHWVVFGAVCLLAYLFFVHPDVIETSNHSYLLLDSIFKGRFLDFYNYVMEHPFQKNLYYINNAHYNIVIYAIFAIAELPVFIFNAIFGTAINEPLLYYIGKLVSLGFFVTCIPLVRRIASQLGFSNTDSHWASFFFATFPPAFFSAVVMGQYDTLCLFFLLLGFSHWLKGNYWAFTLWFGVGAACKFFPLLVFIPLLLLVEKRPLHLLKYGAASLWLVAPTTLLYMGRTGDMSLFNDLMISRLFAAKIPAAVNISIFPLLLFVLFIACYLYTPAKQLLAKTGLWACLASFGLLFMFVNWHPQWFILIAPFLVLTTFAEKERVPWFWLNIALSAGFFILCATAYAYQLEANLLDFGLVGIITNLLTSSSPGYNSISFYYNLLPVILALPMVLVGGVLTANVLLKAPGKNGTLASRLAAGNAALTTSKYGWFAWGVFAGGTAIWLLPTLFTWLKCFNFL
ncbi:hypothetical protein LJC61_08540 [Ruminococcaceae bacterium OttesenSCG-928-A16]|nr:hypothetical protein [Ruminococcaceae bacterium OttesenSCG-928-A16]